MTDLELLNAYLQRQDQRAFADLVARHVNWLYAAARRQLGDSAEAEDAVQAVFLMLLRKAPSLRDDVRLSGWLFQTLRYVCHHARRATARRQRHERHAATLAPAHATADWETIATDLDEALARLSRADRDLLILRYFRQLDAPEIAAQLGVAEPALRKRLSRAVERLRPILTPAATAAPAGSLAAVVLAQAAPAAPAQIAAPILNLVSGPIPTGVLMLARRTALSFWLPKALMATAALVMVSAGAIYIAAQAGGDSALAGEHRIEVNGSSVLRGNGRAVSEQRTVPEFHALETSGAFTIDVSSGPQQQITVRADDNLLPHLHTEVSNGRLSIFYDTSIQQSTTSQIRIVMPRSLNAITCSGACTIDARGLDTKQLNLEFSGAGQITLSGTATDLKANLSGAGQIDARDLSTSNAKVDVSGVGSLTLTATQSLDASISGTGHVTCHGNPPVVHRRISGVGSLAVGK